MTEWRYDVVVVGTGFAGLSAATEARVAGASVLVIDKMNGPGGISIMSDRGMAVPGSARQRRAGIEDSPDLMYEDMMKAGMGLNHPRLVRTVVDHAVEAFEWAVEFIGVEFLDRIDLFGGHSVPRNHAAAKITGASIVRPLLKKAEELGVEFRMATKLRHIVIDNGAVRGIDVEPDYDHHTDAGGPIERVASPAIVLASGGFGADVAFRSAQDPRLSEEIDTTNKPSAKADALIEALRIGSAPIHLSHIQLGPWASPDEKGFGNGPLFADYIGFIHGIVVRPDTGTRFVDERSDRKTVSDAILAVGEPCICIADHRVVEESGLDLSKALRTQVVRTHDTVHALAGAYGMPAEALGTTIDESKVDADCPPFYAMRLWPKVHFTMGGIGIDEHARVLDLEGTPTPGFYAAGEVTGGVHGACRLGSCAITECLVFGRIAGREAAAFAAHPFA